MHWEIKNFVRVTLLQQSGTQAAISLRYASTHSLEFLQPLGKQTNKK